MSGVDALIRETKQWVRRHREHGRRIEALAAAIRLRALMDAKAAMEAKK